MSWTPVGADKWPRSGFESQTQGSIVSARLRIASLVLRTVFIVLLLVIVARVSMPQSASLWTAYQSPGDLVRLALGLVFCIWVASQVFTMPKDAHAHRIWIYLGLVAVPFTLVCMFGTW
jgi:hypothetical protein